MEKKQEYRTNNIKVKSIIGLIGILLLVSCGKDDAKPNFSCGEKISLTNDVMPIINANCTFTTCHGGNQSPSLTSKSAVIENASLIRSAVVGGFMPPSSPLESELVDLIRCWVDDGAKDN